MKLIVLGLVATALATPSKTVRLAIVHTVHGCHVWHSGTRDAGAATKLTLRRGDKLALRVTCPMDFTLTQLRGPRLAIGDPTLHSGTVRSISFRVRGIYVLRRDEHPVVGADGASDARAQQRPDVDDQRALRKGDRDQRRDRRHREVPRREHREHEHQRERHPGERAQASIEDARRRVDGQDVDGDEAGGGRATRLSVSLTPARSRASSGTVDRREHDERAPRDAAVASPPSQVGSAPSFASEAASFEKPPM